MEKNNKKVADVLIIHLADEKHPNGEWNKHVTKIHQDVIDAAERSSIEYMPSDESYQNYYDLISQIYSFNEEKDLRVEQITVNPLKLLEELDGYEPVNVGVFAHGGYSAFGIRSPQPPHGKEKIFYIDFISLLRKWEQKGLMSVTFFSCNTLRPRLSVFVPISNLFPSVIFLGCGTLTTKTKIIASNMQALLEYFTLHAKFVNPSDVEKFKLRREVVKAAKEEILDKISDQELANNLYFANTEEGESTMAAMRSLVFQCLDKNLEQKSILMWLFFHEMTAVQSGETGYGELKTRQCIDSLMKLLELNDEANFTIEIEKICKIYRVQELYNMWRKVTTFVDGDYEDESLCSFIKHFVEEQTLGTAGFLRGVQRLVMEMITNNDQDIVQFIGSILLFCISEVTELPVPLPDLKLTGSHLKALQDTKPLCIFNVGFDQIKAIWVVSLKPYLFLD